MALQGFIQRRLSCLARQYIQIRCCSAVNAEKPTTPQPKIQPEPDPPRRTVHLRIVLKNGPAETMFKLCDKRTAPKITMAAFQELLRVLGQNIEAKKGKGSHVKISGILQNAAGEKFAWRMTLPQAPKTATLHPYQVVAFRHILHKSRLITSF